MNQRPSSSDSSKRAPSDRISQRPLQARAGGKDLPENRSDSDGGGGLHSPQNSNTHYVVHEQTFVEKLFTQEHFAPPQRNRVALVHLIVCLAFVILGILCAAFNSSVNEVVIDDYGTQCMYQRSCVVQVKPSVTLLPPIYVQYELRGFHQNDRRYVQSHSNAQLSGEEVTLSRARTQCSPIVTNADLKPYLKTYTSYADVPLIDDEIASPCGLIARSMFNDTYRIYADAQRVTRIAISEKGIAWPGDSGDRYARAENSEATQWIDPQDEHFAVWMRTAGRSNFRKLWGRIEYGVLQAGVHYYIEISNNYDVNTFKGTKSLVLTTGSIIGGRNPFLVGALFAAGTLFLALAYAYWRFAPSAAPTVLDILLTPSGRPSSNQHQNVQEFLSSGGMRILAAAGSLRSPTKRSAGAQTAVSPPLKDIETEEKKGKNKRKNDLEDDL